MCLFTLEIVEQAAYTENHPTKCARRDQECPWHVEMTRNLENHGSITQPPSDTIPRDTQQNITVTPNNNKHVLVPYIVR